MLFLWFLSAPEAAAVVACERIVARLNSPPQSSDSLVSPAKSAVSPALLDSFLWHIGKDPQYRSFARHAAKSVYY